MSDIPGLVCTADDDHEAVFLSTADVSRVIEATSEILSRPSFAGTVPDADVLAEMQRLLESATDSGTTSIVMSDPMRTWLEIIRDRGETYTALQEGNRLRVRRCCSTCGLPLIVNPTREAQKAAQEAKERDAARAGSLLAIATSSDSHPYLSLLRAFHTSVNAGGSPGEAVYFCQTCGGDKFDDPDLVTFCPGCRKLRDEAILVTCPECNFEFGTLLAQKHFWTDLKQARREFNSVLLARKGSSFEKGLWVGQKKAFMSFLSGEEQLIAMCRCALPGEVGRYVALLFTSTYLAWSWETALSSTKSGKIPWTDVTEIVDPASSDTRYESGLKVISRNRGPVAFNDFRGSGVMLGERTLRFDAAGVRQLATHLWRESTATTKD